MIVTHNDHQNIAEKISYRTSSFKSIHMSCARFTCEPERQFIAGLVRANVTVINFQNATRINTHFSVQYGSGLDGSVLA